MAHSLAAHELCTCGHLLALHSYDFSFVAVEGFGGACERCNCESYDPNDTQICTVCNQEDPDE
jgi:hypothetical protein